MTINEEYPMMNHEELVDYIFEKLVGQGVAVTRKSIDLVLQLELDFMIEKGYATFVEDGE